jgi:cell division protein FtsW
VPRKKSNKIKKTVIKTKNVIKRGIHYEPDYSLILLVIFFLIFGLLMIFSASAVIAYLYNDGDTFFFFKRQIIWIGVGSIIGFILYKVQINKYKKLGIYLLIATFLLMLYLIPEALFKVEFPFVKTLNGATRWIDLGFFDLQPSEIAKLAIILFSAGFFSLSEKFKKNIEIFIDKRFSNNQTLHIIVYLSFKLLPFIVMGLLAAFVLFQKDLDTLVIIGLIFMTMFYVSNKGSSHNFATIVLLVGCLIAGYFAMTLENYRKVRVDSFVQILINGQPDDPRGPAFQVWNGLVALGNGGFLGVGYGNSRQKLFFLQEAAYTDSIYTIVGEEFGLAGSLLVILGFLIFLSIGLKIANEAENKFAALVAVGITSWITIQAFLNISANLAVIPFGGMPLPFLTYGGSNTIMILAGIGILLNISKKRVE